MRRYELKEARNMTMSLSAGCGAKGRDQLRPWVSLVLFLVSIASIHSWKSELFTVTPFGISEPASLISFPFRAFSKIVIVA